MFSTARGGVSRRALPSLGDTRPAPHREGHPTPTEGPSAGGGGAGTLERGNNDDRPSPQLSAPMPAAKAREEIRAAVYDRKAEEGIRVVTKRAPKLGRGDVLVRVRACGVNPVDAKFVVADKLPESWRGAARWLVDGRVAGFDLSGVVERAYPGSGFEVGEEVFGAVPPMRGSFADLVAVPSSQLATKPHPLTHAEAAALVLPGLTVVQALRQHGFGPARGCWSSAPRAGSVTSPCRSRRLAAHSWSSACAAAETSNLSKSMGADDVLDYEALEPVPDDDEAGVHTGRIRWWRHCVRCCRARRPSLRPGAGHRLEPRREGSAHEVQVADPIEPGVARRFAERRRQAQLRDDRG